MSRFRIAFLFLIGILVVQSVAMVTPVKSRTVVIPVIDKDTGMLTNKDVLLTKDDIFRIKLAEAKGLKVYPIVDGDKIVNYVVVPDYSKMKPGYHLDWYSIRMDDRNLNRINDELEPTIASDPEKEVTVIVIQTMDDPTAKQKFLTLGGKIKHEYKYVLKGFAGTIKAKYLPEIANVATVAIINPDRTIKIDMLNAPKVTGVRPIVWDYLANTYGTYGYSGISIAIIDTGVDPNHPMLSGYSDAASNPNVWTDPTIKIVGWYDYINGQTTPYDDGAHGSHVAGIAAGWFYDMNADSQNRGVIYDALGVKYTGFGQDYQFYRGFSTYVYVDDPNQDIYVEVYFQDVSEQGTNTNHYTQFNSTEIYDPQGNRIYWVGNDGTGDLLNTDPNAIAYSVNLASLGATEPGIYRFRHVFFYNYDIFVRDGGAAGAAYWAYIHLNYSEPTDGYAKISGVAPDVKIVGLKVMDASGSGSLTDLVSALDWCVANKDTYHIVIASMSLGTGPGSVDSSTNNAITNLVSNGILAVVAAGNDGPDLNTIGGSPGLADAAVTVAASTVGLLGPPGITDYSSRGPGSDTITGNTTKPDIAAPGGSSSSEATIVSVDTSYYDAADVYLVDYSAGSVSYDSTVTRTEQYTGDLVIFQGTSMATPHASGAASLIISALIGYDYTKWNYTAAEAMFVKALMGATAWEIDEKNRGGKDPSEGWGLIQVDAAIDAITKEYTIGTYVAEGLTSESFGKHVWARKVYLTAGRTYTFDLTVPSGADFDIYLWAWDPKPDSSSPFGTWGEPLLVAWSNNSVEGADEHIQYTPSTSGWYILTIKQISGSGTFQFNSTEALNPPTVEIVNPSSGDEVSGTITVQASASDVSPGTVTSVILYIDGGSPTEMTYSSTSGYWEYSLDTTLLSEGQHVLQAKAIDDEGNVGWSNVVEIYVNNYPAQVLVVDDDAGAATESYFMDALSDLGVDYDYYEVPSGADGPTSTVMSSYSIVIWFTGADYQNTLTDTDVTNLQTYLDNGGNFFLSSQDVIYVRGTSDTFIQNYLATSTVSQDIGSISGVNGATGSVFEGVSYSLSYPYSPYPDAISPYDATGTEGNALEWASGTYAGNGAAVWHDSGTYKTMFFAFPFEAISPREDRADAMKRILSFFGYDFPPEITITSPADGSGTNQTSITVYWTASDDYGIDHFEIYLDVNAIDTAVSSTATSYTITGLTDGLHTIKVYAVDTNNQKSYDEITIWVDSTAPTVTITNPSDGATFDSGTTSVTVNWTGSDNYEMHHYEVRLNGGSWINVGLNLSWTFTGLTDGSYTVDVKAVDTAGNTAIDTVTFTIGTSDTTPPTITITAPNDGDILASSSITVTWSASDAESGIAYYDLYVDGSAYATGLSASTTSYTISLSDGSHTITVYAYDNAGNSNSDSVTITVDTTAPSVSITSPADGSTLSSSSITVEWSGSDATSGIAYYDLYVDGSAYATGLSASTTSYTISSLSDGSHTITVYAYDNAGNVGSSSVTITIEEPPSVVIESPTEDPNTGESYVAGDSVALSWSASDNSGIDYYEVYVDGTLVATLGPDQTNYVIDNLGEGVHNITIRAYDTSGNYNDSIIQVTIDLSPPSISASTSLLLVDSSATSVSISWSGSDSVSGIDHYEVYVGGSWTNVGTSTSYTIDTSSLSEGIYAVYIRAFDKAGYESQDVVMLIVDRTAPTLSIAYPTAGSIFSSSSVMIVWSASDNLIGVDHFEISTDGTTWINVGRETSYLWSGLSDGSYTFYVRAYDASGNYAEASVSFSIDLTAPDITITSPSDGELISSSSVTVYWSSSASDVAYYLVRLDDGSWIDVGTSTSYTFAVSDGVHVIYVMAVDNAGLSSVASVMIVVDTTSGASVPPTVRTEPLYVDNTEFITESKDNTLADDVSIADNTENSVPKITSSNSIIEPNRDTTPGDTYYTTRVIVISFVVFDIATIESDDKLFIEYTPVFVGVLVSTVFYNSFVLAYSMYLIRPPL